MGKYLFASLTFLFCAQCTWQEKTLLTPQIDSEKASVQVLKELVPQLTGQWTMRQVKIKYQYYNNDHKYFLKITRDTTFTNLATLNIGLSSSSDKYPESYRLGHYEGTLEYAGKNYPVEFALSPSLGKLFNAEVHQGSFLFEYNHNIGSRILESEADFLEKLGLINDTFLLEIKPDQSKKMVWKGLNRGIEAIDLVKN